MYMILVKRLHVHFVANLLSINIFRFTMRKLIRCRLERTVLKLHVQFCLITSLIAHVHGKVRHKTIVSITNSIRICIIYYLCVGVISVDY